MIATTERLFEIRANGTVLHLAGRSQVAELIGLLGQALVDAEEIDARGYEHTGQTWNIRNESQPVPMECRSMRVPVKKRGELRT